MEEYHSSTMSARNVFVREFITVVGFMATIVERIVEHRRFFFLVLVV